MISSLNRFAAQSVFEGASIVALPAAAWVAMFRISGWLHEPWLSVASGAAMLVAMLASFGTATRLASMAELFRGCAIWRFFGGVLLQLALFYVLAIASNAVCIWMCADIERHLAPRLSRLPPDSWLRPACASGAPAIIVFAGALLPVGSGLTVVWNHNFEKFGIPFGIPPMTRMRHRGDV